MSVVTRNLDATPNGIPPALIGVSPEEMLTIMNTAMIEASDRAAQRAHAVADSLIKASLKDIEARFAAVEIPKPQIMAVEVDGYVQKLKGQAVPYLGRMIIHAKCRKNTLLIGPAGCGKTYAAEQLAEALKLEFGHVCFTAGASETWLFGRQTPNGFIEGTFSRLYRCGGVFLADEMDAADANMLLALNTALANGHMFNPINGETYKKHADFVFVGAANTVGKGGDAVYTGRARLDGSTLDRFTASKFEVDYDTDVEKKLCPDSNLYNALKFARAKLREQRSDEIISTRAFQDSFELMTAGIEVLDIFKSITLRWPEELISACKLDRYDHAPKKANYQAAQVIIDECADIFADAKPDMEPKKLSDTDAKIAENNRRIEELKQKLAARR